MNLYRKKYKFIEIYSVFLIDLISIAISYYIARKLRIILPFGADITEETMWFPIYIFCIIGCILFNFLLNKYEGFFNRGFFIEFEKTIEYNVFQFVFQSTCVYLFRLEGDFSRLMLIYYIIINIAITFIFRILYKKYMLVFYKKSSGSDKVLVVTEKGLISDIKSHFYSDHQSWNYEIIGFSCLDMKNKEDTKENDEGNEDISIISGREDLVDSARFMSVDLVFFYCLNNYFILEDYVKSFILMGIKCYVCIPNLGFDIPLSGVDEFADFPVMCFNVAERDYKKVIIKRIADVIGGFFGTLLTALITPFLAIAIKIEDPKGPVFFSQIRIGKNGRRFKIYKFRSMYNDAEERKKDLIKMNQMEGPIFKIDDDPRITKVGKFLRKTSLDEFPQFFNILKGDMSLVGTRPPTVDEFEQYNDYYRRRMSITPGLTGLWQVSGRSNIKDFEEIVRLDLKYIDNWSIGNDLKIILQTIGVVLGRKGSK